MNNTPINNTPTQLGPRYSLGTRPALPLLDKTPSGGPPPEKKARTVAQTDSCVVPYVIHQDQPLFALAGAQLAQTFGPGHQDYLQQIYQPEPALLGHVLADEIKQQVDQLLNHGQLHISLVDYEPVEQTLTLSFPRKIPKGGEHGQPQLLGGERLKQQPHTSKSIAPGHSLSALEQSVMAISLRSDKTANNHGKSEQAPVEHRPLVFHGIDRIQINLNTGTAEYTSTNPAVDKRHFFLGEQPSGQEINAIDRLGMIQRLLLQRAVGELLHNKNVLDRLQSTTDHKQQTTLLHQITTVDRLAVSNQERLGFEVIITENDQGLSLTLDDIDPQVVQKVWGSCHEQQLLSQVSSVLSSLYPELEIVPTETGINLPISIDQLVKQLQHNSAGKIGVAIVNEQGAILKVTRPQPKTTCVPVTSPACVASKTPLCPKLGAIVKAYEDAGVVPTNLNYWHFLGQNNPTEDGDDAMLLVAPQGYQEGTSQQQHWLDLADIRSGRFGTMLLQAEWSHLIAYLNFEKERISAILGAHFPGVTIAIAGADLATDNPGSNNPERLYGLIPTQGIGQLTITADNEQQVYDLSSVLFGLLCHINTFSPGKYEFTLNDNPYVIFKTLCAGIQRRYKDRLALTNGLLPQEERWTPYGRGHCQALPEKQISVADAVTKLELLKERLAVADVYRKVVQQSTKHTAQDGQQPPLPTNMEALLPLMVDQYGKGLYLDIVSGDKYCLNPCTHQAAASNEVLMAQLARSSGLLVPDTDLLQGPSRTWVISPWQPNLQIGEQAVDVTKMDKPQLARLFLAAAWLGHGELVDHGLHHTGVDDQQRIHVLNWRGAGYDQQPRLAPRPDHISHLDSFRHRVSDIKDRVKAQKHLATAQLLAILTEEDIANELPAFTNQARQNMIGVLEKYGPRKQAQRTKLTETLLTRLNQLQHLYPVGDLPQNQPDHTPSALSLSSSTANSKSAYQPTKGEMSAPQLYNTYLAQHPQLPKWVKGVISCTCIYSFNQLLTVNPQLDAGKVVSLEGVRLQRAKVSNLNLTGINLRNSELSNVTFTNCQVAGADLSEVDLSNVHWNFTKPAKQAADIDWVAKALEQAFVTSGHTSLLEKLMELYFDTGRVAELLPLLEKHGQHLLEQDVLRCVETLLTCANIDRQVLMNYLDSLEQPMSRMQHLKLRCAQKLGTEVLARCLQRINIRELCLLFPNMEAKLQDDCWPHIKDTITREQRYTLVPALNLSHRFYDRLRQWTEQVPQELLCRELEINARKVSKAPGQPEAGNSGSPIAP